ncbi:polysaccharide deacetylase family protein [Synergistaceae bacterium OttesenSCG-928-I11]|nr:polysaccharide deacetylase family protein [Synergistaceae bacterium OttesenSCG-928-I11]
MKILALKIYIDSIQGYREGVPKLLDIMSELDIAASIYFGMGTEDDGSVMSRIFREEKEIVASAPGIIRDAHRRGHDCGIYGWNPREWQLRLEKMKDTTLEADIKRSVEYFARRTGNRPAGFAAPGFRATYISLRIQDDVRFKYCSDTFGHYPFLPKISWKTFATPQVPATLPPLEIMLQKCTEAVVRTRMENLSDTLPDGLSVLPMNAVVASVPEIFPPLYEFITRCHDTGTRFVTLHRVVQSLDAKNLPQCEVVSAKAFGMPREVAVQSTD